MLLDPNEEGLTHINIYSKAQSPLGRYMSNFDKCWIETSIGQFASIEGLIFFLGSFDDRLRNLAGYDAKALGEKVDRKIRLPEDVFKRLVVEAMQAKVDGNDHLRQLLKECKLPFTHYYHYGTKVIYIPKWDWQVQEWDKIRKNLQGDIL